MISQLKPRLIAVVGQTCSGKTALAVELAKKFDGEVISADSRQVYRGLDLGTGKVTSAEMQGIPHHLLDVADPTVVYSASQFVETANQVIVDTLARKHVPVVAGGTFFYLDLLRNRCQSAPVPPNEIFREQMAGLSGEILYRELCEKDPLRANSIDRHNRHRVIRALEIVEALGNVPPIVLSESPYEWLVIGLKIDQEQLFEKIHERIVDRIDQGMIEEVQNLHKAGLSYERLENLGLEYRYLALYLQNRLSKAEMIDMLNLKSRQFAKRQLTWLKRDLSIEWFAPENREAIFRRVTKFLKT